MATLADALETLKEGLREGRLFIRFEGVRPVTREVALTVELEAHREDGTWQCVMRTGDGQRSGKAFPDADAEKELTAAIVAIHQWLKEKEPKN